MDFIPSAALDPEKYFLSEEMSGGARTSGILSTFRFMFLLEFTLVATTRVKRLSLFERAIRTIVEKN